MFTTNKLSKSLIDAVSTVVSEEKECVTKPEAKTIAKKEVGKHEKSMHKEDIESVEEGIGDTIKKVAKKAAEVLGGPDDEGHKKDLQKKMGIPQTGKPGHAKQNEETQLTFKERLIEREMTKKETKKKEDIVMSMKKNKEYFKKKYGSRWKEVMYATATKQAMGEELELDDEQIEEQHDVSTDMLSGRVQGVGQSNSFKNFKVKIEGSQKTAREPEAASAPSTKAKESITAHGGGMNPVAQPRIGVEGHGEVTFAKEDTVEEGWDDMLKDVKSKSGPQPSGGSGVKKGTRYGGSKQKDKPEHDDEKVKKEEVELTEGKDPSIDAGAGSAPNFVSPENTTSSPVMKRVKEIAHSAMSRVKTEMLGKAPGNQ